MLVLSRKRNEVIRIGEDVEVMVVEIRGDKVRLGIKAPDGVRVDRKEIWAARKRVQEQEQAQAGA
jgi:carbon storage regulator